MGDTKNPVAMVQHEEVQLRAWPREDVVVCRATKQATVVEEIQERVMGKLKEPVAVGHQELVQQPMVSDENMPVGVNAARQEASVEAQKDCQETLFEQTKDFEAVGHHKLMQAVGRGED